MSSFNFDIRTFINRFFLFNIMVKKSVWEKTNNFVYRNFKLSLNYIKNLKNYIWFVSLMLFCFGLIGFMLPIFFQEQVLNLIKELIEKTQGLDTLNLIRFIFINNLKSSFFAMIFGIFFGIAPIAVAVVNGYVLGFVANKAVISGGVSVLWRLLPHGIFELPAVLISIAIGLKLGISFIYNCIIEYNKNLTKLSIFLLILLSILFFPISIIIVGILTIINKNLRKRFFSNLDIALRVFIFIIIPLLVIAAIIEGGLIVLLG